MKQVWPAPERNKQPILDVIRPMLPARGSVLEIASGSGQHAAYFASQLPGLSWQPTDVDDANLASIEAYREEANLPNLLPARCLDVLGSDWGVGLFDAVFNANMIHITPWECCEALLVGAARHLHPGGALILYGPYRLEGRHTAPSNEAFDLRLKQQDPRWGVRDLEAVVEVAERAGFAFISRTGMPANNQTLFMRRR